MSERNAKLLRKYHKSEPGLSDEFVKTLGSIFQTRTSKERAELRRSLQLRLVDRLTKVQARRERVRQ